MKLKHLTTRLALLILLIGTMGRTSAVCRSSLPLLSSSKPEVIQNEENEQKWREDLQALVAGLRQNHPNPFHGIPEAEFEEAVASIDARIAMLTDSQINREFVGLAALISRNGRDGHTHYLPSLMNLHALPLQLYNFSEGLFIIDARQPHEGSIGMRVTAIGEHPIEDIIEALTPYIARDNDSTVQWNMPTFLIFPEFLESLGFIAEGEQIQLHLQDEMGEQEMISISPITIPEYMSWREIPAIKLPQTRDELYLSDSYDPFWFVFLKDSGTLYIRYNQILEKNDSGMMMKKFVKKIKKNLKKKPVQRLVIDLR